MGPQGCGAPINPEVAVNSVKPAAYSVAAKVSALMTLAVVVGAPRKFG